MRIEFDVDGKPPSKSGWDNKEGLIKKFREKALAARNKAGISKGDEHRVKIDLTVYTSNISDRELVKGDDPSKYSGDLDGFISGICDYLGPAEKNVTEDNVHIELKKQNEINYKIPLIIHDDAKIAEINARKVPGDKEWYRVEIVFLDENLKELD